MKAKQNLEFIKKDETLIITGVNCNDVLIFSLKNDAPKFRILRDTDKSTLTSTSIYLNRFPENYREIEFSGKMFVVGNKIITPSLFCIEEKKEGLSIRPVQRKVQNQDLLNR